jgi:hypothetical protein
MNQTAQSPRRDSFAWQSKQELYDYFVTMHHVDRKEIDSEIEMVLKTFQIRKGRPINPQELWEKVGVNLEKRHKKANDEADDNEDDEVDLELLEKDRE